MHDIVFSEPVAPVPCSSFSLSPRPPNILLKVNKHGDSTTQDREPVSDGYIAQHYRG